LRRELMSRSGEPPEWGDIYEHEDAAFYESEEFERYVEEIERPTIRRHIGCLLSRFMHVTPNPDTDYITNGVFLKVYANINGHMLAGLPSATDRLKRFRKFVYMIALHEVCDHVREELRHRGVSECAKELQRQGVKDHVLGELAQSESQGSAPRVEGVQLVALKSALSRLSELDRFVLLRHAESKHNEERIYRDLAKELGCSEAALRVRRSRALTKLLALLQSELPDDPVFQNRQEKRRT
jgi:DNA-directed RNA polymerase specialized sigma24 family protein